MATTCKKCNTPLNEEGFCRDETCPFSSWEQKVELDDLHNLSTQQIERKYHTLKV